MTEEKTNILWERELIEQLLLKKNQNSCKKWRWILFIFLLILIIFFIFRLTLFNFNNTVFYQKHIAVLNLTDEISETENTLEKLIDGLENIYSNHEYITAIIIKANSPGGSPVISDTIFQEIKYYKSLYPNIPIYSVVENMCASGCYYIISATDKIYANPSSIIGSIGVIMPNYDLTGLANKFGIKDRTKTSGKNKDLGNPLAKETPEQNQILKNILNEIHDEFINKVKEGRGEKLAWERYPDVFSGQIYTGKESKKIGLIDDFGSIYSVSRTIMQEPIWVNYTPDENLRSYIKKIIGVNLKDSILEIIKSSIGNFK